MNAAQTYKHIIFQKRTYFRSCLIALLFLGLAAGEGYIRGYDEAEELAMEEERTEDIQKNPSKVPYIEHFKHYAPSVGWDWELLAAVAYHESRFNPNTVSPGGARGLMQLMPVTGEKFGLNDSTFFLPEDNIRAGCKYITRLQHQFKGVKDSVEMAKFVLASYNAGPAHILDARALARKYGANPDRWDDVEYYIGMLRYEEYYTDSVVRYGFFKGRETTAYVHNTLRTYRQIQHGEFDASKRLIARRETLPSDSADLAPDSSAHSPAYIPSPLVNPSVVAAHTVAVPHHPDTSHISAEKVEIPSEK